MMNNCGLSNNSGKAFGQIENSLSTTYSPYTSPLLQTIDRSNLWPLGYKTCLMSLLKVYVAPLAQLEVA